MGTCGAVILVAIGLVGADAAKDAAREDIAKWQGTWRAIAMETDGKPAADDKIKDIRLTVTGTDYHFQNGAFSEHGRYKFDATKDPRSLDIVVGDGKDKGKVYLVIYKISDDRLTLCFRSDNKSRPESFSGAAGSGCVLEEWQRIKPVK
jgi:uncharacterized protein (TIGR03067 family)